MTLRYRTVLLWAAVATMGGCATSAPRATAPLPPPPTVLDVRMEEFAFVHLPQVPAGRVVIRVTNAGSQDHDIAIARLPDDLDGTIGGPRSSGAPVVGQTVRLLPPLAPATNATFAVDLTPGRYGLACAVPAADGDSHAAKGMVSELRVTAQVK